MTVLQVADLRFGYAGETLFESVTFTLALGERAALVAPNGAGKSTLLRLIAGEVEPDQGTVVRKRDVSFGYYRQSHELAASGDVLGAFLSRFGDVVGLRAELSQAQEDAASGSAEALDRLSVLQDRYHLARGDELEREVGILANKLGFSDADLARPVSTLSGGERGRLQLGVVLAQKPDLLLLDEPTNHLDLDTIGWLESYLVGYRGAVLIVSHDRAFLDTVAPSTMELGVRALRVYPLKYSDYAIAREEDMARENAVAARQEAMIAKTEDFIRKNIAGQKTKQAQSRRKMLDKVERLDRAEDVWNTAERIVFRFAPANRSGDIVLDARGLGASRGGRPLFSGVDLLVRRGERIGIVGPNGAGKSTLLKLLAGRGAPEDTSAIKRGTNLQEGYFDQHLGQVDPALTAVDNVRRVRGDFTVEAARQYLARFRFYGDDTLRVVSGFSGGERTRLALAKLLLEPRNLLFLDEPTNHMDIPAAEILEEALVGFEGTVILVSHDRRFLEKTTTRLITVRDAHVDIYPGGFRDWSEMRERVASEQAAQLREEKERERAASKSSARVAVDTGSRESPRRAEAKKNEQPRAGASAAGAAANGGGADKKTSYDQQRQASRERERRAKRIGELENSIALSEAELSVLRDKLKGDPGGDWAKLAEMATKEQALAKRLETMMSEWTKLSEGSQ